MPKDVQKNVNMFSASELTSNILQVINLLDKDYEVTINKKSKGLYSIEYAKLHKMKKAQ